MLTLHLLYGTSFHTLVAFGLSIQVPVQDSQLSGPLAPRRLVCTIHPFLSEGPLEQLVRDSGGELTVTKGTLLTVYQRVDTRLTKPITATVD